ncbi:MAG TPA: mannose-1-phosphate guanylyltransferase [Polyangia bacterium]|nr:mannose-1-phosphate guanylyltransferase [Polyangia bacterium]
MTTEKTSGAAFAVVLGGGAGTRLWPASRRARPKQLLSLGGPESLLAAAVRRARALVGLERTLIVTAADQEAAVRADLPELPPANVVAEPVPRNTAAAVGLGAVEAARRAGPEAVIAVFPADPFIGDERAFDRLVRAAIAEARETITTIGVRPTHAETGFGYLRLGARLPRAGGDPVHEVAGFVEKPDLPTAERYLASGEYLWNSGMFFLTAGRMLEEARRHLPKLAALLDAAVAAKDAGAAAAAIAAGYRDVPAISIDNGIMEKAGGLRVVPGAFGWNDVGSWAALPAMRAPDARGNVVLGGATLIDGDGNVVVAEEGAPFVGVVGVRDLVVVATRDALLVVPKEKAQDVRKIVEAAKQSGRIDLL